MLGVWTPEMGVLSAWLPLVFVLLMLAVCTGFGIAAIRIEGQHTRERNQYHAEILQAKLEEIHLNTNSALTSVRASLEQAHQRIVSLEAALVVAIEGRDQAEARLKEEG